MKLSWVATPPKLSDLISHKGTLRLHQCRKLVIKALVTYSEQNEPQQIDPGLCAVSLLSRGNLVWDCFYGRRSAQDLVARTSLLKALLAPKRNQVFWPFMMTVIWRLNESDWVPSVGCTLALAFNNTCRPHCVHSIQAFVTRGRVGQISSGNSKNYQTLMVNPFRQTFQWKILQNWLRTGEMSLAFNNIDWISTILWFHFRMHICVISFLLMWHLLRLVSVTN